MTILKEKFFPLQLNNNQSFEEACIVQNWKQKIIKITENSSIKIKTSLKDKIEFYRVKWSDKHRCPEKEHHNE